MWPIHYKALQVRKLNHNVELQENHTLIEFEWFVTTKYSLRVIKVLFLFSYPKTSSCKQLVMTSWNKISSRGGKLYSVVELVCSLQKLVTLMRKILQDENTKNIYATKRIIYYFNGLFIHVKYNFSLVYVSSPKIA